MPRKVELADVLEILEYANAMIRPEDLTPLDDAEAIILANIQTLPLDVFDYILSYNFKLIYTWTSRPFSLFQKEILREYLRREESASSFIKEERKKVINERGKAL